jgi:5'-methylthioadenosine phosphorylase
VQRLLSVSAVGSLTEAHAPGDFVLADQFVDRTFRRETSFFGGGAVVHVPLADPTCEDMARVVLRQAAGLPMRVSRGGTYVCIEGPQFSTRAESHLHRAWGCSLVGMTNVTEAKLAREAGMSFLCVAMVTDYDCWHSGHGDVDVAKVLEVAGRNARNARDLVRRAIAPLAALGPSPWRGIARAGLITAPERIPAEARARYALLLGLEP